MERQRLRVKLNPPYLNILNPEKAEELSRRIAELLIVNRRFRDKDVTAKGIAKERRGTINREPCQFLDIMPTCIELADATYPTTYDGHAIKPL